MKAAKLFRWEAAHRLPWYDGPCSHLHGHSYRMLVEVEGTPDERGMLIDFKDLKALVGPLVKAWDHATLVGQDDRALYDACQALGTKLFVFPFDTTSENLCRYVADYLRDQAADVLAEQGITRVTIRLNETETCYAEHVGDLAPPHHEHAGAHAQEAHHPAPGQPQHAPQHPAQHVVPPQPIQPSEVPMPGQAPDYAPGATSADPAWRS